MKKIITTLVLAITLFSCSKTEDSVQEDLIVGKWKITAATIQDGATGTPEDFTDQCTSLNLYTYNSNKSVTALINNYSTTTSKCVANPVINATWANIGNGVYSLTFAGDNVPQTSTIAFSNSNKTMNETVLDGNYILKTTYARQ